MKSQHMNTKQVRAQHSHCRASAFAFAHTVASSAVRTVQANVCTTCGWLMRRLSTASRMQRSSAAASDVSQRVYLTATGAPRHRPCQAAPLHSIGIVICAIISTSILALLMAPLINGSQHSGIASHRVHWWSELLTQRCMGAHLVDSAVAAAADALLEVDLVQLQVDIGVGRLCSRCGNARMASAAVFDASCEHTCALPDVCCAGHFASMSNTSACIFLLQNRSVLRGATMQAGRQAGLGERMIW